MKIVLFLFAFIFLIGGIVLFSSSPKNSQTSLASNTAEIVSKVTPTETPISIIPTKVVSKTNSKIQIIKATYGQPFGFTPTEFTVKVGIPVRLEVYATENGRGCMGSITIPNLTQDIQSFIKDQTNVFEFTPTSLGEYPITCAMGIPHGTIIIK